MGKRKLSPYSKNRNYTNSFIGEKLCSKLKNLIIRKFKTKDSKDLYEYLSQAKIFTFEPGKPLSSKEAKQTAKKRSKGDNFYAVELKSSGKMIGHLYFKQIEPLKFKTWELGYIFNPAYQ